MLEGVIFELKKPFLKLSHNFKMAKTSVLWLEVLDFLGPSSSVGKLSNRILHTFSL